MAVWRFGGLAVWRLVSEMKQECLRDSIYTELGAFAEGMEANLAEPTFEKWLLLQNAPYIELTL